MGIYTPVDGTSRQPLVPGSKEPKLSGTTSSVAQGRSGLGRTDWGARSGRQARYTCRQGGQDLPVFLRSSATRHGSP
jgi:hypothetical protein